MPFNSNEGMVFDAAVQRWQAMQFTYGDNFKPTLSNFGKFSLCLIFPVIGFYQLIWGPAHTEYIRYVDDAWPLLYDIYIQSFLQTLTNFQKNLQR